PAQSRSRAAPRTEDGSCRSAWSRDAAVLQQLLERGARRFGAGLEFAQQALLVVVDLAVGEQRLTEPAGLGVVDGAVGQHVRLDRLDEQGGELGGTRPRRVPQVDQERPL